FNGQLFKLGSTDCNRKKSRSNPYGSVPIFQRGSMTLWIFIRVLCPSLKIFLRRSTVVITSRTSTLQTHTSKLRWMNSQNNCRQLTRIESCINTTDYLLESNQ
ncbi:hypothetical protein Tcan_00558, partial [Toxocara canis]